MPVPVPVSPEVIVTHVDLVSRAAVHAQPTGVAVTVKDPVPPALGMTSDEAGFMASVQGVPGVPVWVTGSEPPAMVISPVLLEGLVFSGTFIITVPLLFVKVTGTPERVIQSSP